MNTFSNPRILRQHEEQSIRITADAAIHNGLPLGPANIRPWPHPREEFRRALVPPHPLSPRPQLQRGRAGNMARLRHPLLQDTPVVDGYVAPIQEVDALIPPAEAGGYVIRVDDERAVLRGILRRARVPELQSSPESSPSRPGNLHRGWRLSPLRRRHT